MSVPPSSPSPPPSQLATSQLATSPPPYLPQSGSMCRRSVFPCFDCDAEGQLPSGQSHASCCGSIQRLCKENPKTRLAVSILSGVTAFCATTAALAFSSSSALLCLLTGTVSGLLTGKSVSSCLHKIGEAQCGDVTRQPLLRREGPPLPYTEEGLSLTTSADCTYVTEGGNRSTAEESPPPPTYEKATQNE